MNCWCGGALKPTTASAGYLQCEACDTLCAINQFSAEHLKEFYGHQKYWNDYVVNVYSHPNIEVRSHNDKNDRIPFWWQFISERKQNIGSLLEIGCAHGGFLDHCRANGVKDVVGVEVDLETCSYAMQRFNLPVVHAGLWPEVEIDRQFDVVCGFDVLEHFSSPLEALKAIKRVLKPNGSIFFQTPCYRGEDKWNQCKPDEHLHLFNRKSVAKLMNECGFSCYTADACFQHDMMAWGHHL
jgi:SAM-dependent methyltransferase